MATPRGSLAACREPQRGHAACSPALETEGGSMKKIKKLSLGRETIRTLNVGPLSAVVGGLSGNNCSMGLTGCGACPPPRPSLRNTQCQVCASDICSFDECTISIVQG
jgi:hypothetical protein